MMHSLPVQYFKGSTEWLPVHKLSMHTDSVCLTSLYGLKVYTVTIWRSFWHVSRSPDEWSRNILRWYL